MADVVDEGDTRSGDEQGADVRVTARQRAGGVDDRGRLHLDQAFGGDAVEVLVIDHRDLAGTEAIQQVLRPAVHARPPRHHLAIARTHRRVRWRDAAASSSSAWPRAVVLEGLPDSMRDSSTRRASPSTGVAVAIVRSATVSLVTAIC